MKCLEREMSAKLKEISTIFPLLFLTGPRQCGKSTLLKNLFQKTTDYISLDDTQARDFAMNDPKGFLNAFSDSVIIDNIHYAPVLLPHLQNKIDENGPCGIYILSGRLDSSMAQCISKSFGGRAVKFTLLPFSLPELERAARLPKTVNEWMFKGAYPSLLSSSLDPLIYFQGYTSALIEYDIKSELKVYDLNKFRRFLIIAAANSGNLVNLSKLGEAASIDARTANSWISILEEQHILFRLTPYHGSFGKRYTKTPKLYFYDSGLLCFLLGINSADELNFHPMRGRIFETAVISEIAKKHFNAGYKTKLYYWRDLDNSEKEIDLIDESTQKPVLTEIKLSQTVNKEYAKNLLELNASNTDVSSAGKTITKQVIYDGSENLVFENIRYINWKSLSE